MISFQYHLDSIRLMEVSADICYLFNCIQSNTLYYTTNKRSWYIGIMDINQCIYSWSLILCLFILFIVTWYDIDDRWGMVYISYWFTMRWIAPISSIHTLIIFLPSEVIPNSPNPHQLLFDTHFGRIPYLSHSSPYSLCINIHIIIHSISINIPSNPTIISTSSQYYSHIHHQLNLTKNPYNHWFY